MRTARALSLAALGGAALFLTSACGALIGLDAFDKGLCDGDECIAPPPSQNDAGDGIVFPLLDGGTDSGPKAPPCPVRFCANFDQSDDPADGWTSRMASDAQLSVAKGRNTSAPNALLVVGQPKQSVTAALVKSYPTPGGISKANLTAKVDFSAFNALGATAPLLVLSSTAGAIPTAAGNGVVVVAENAGGNVRIRLLEGNIAGTLLSGAGGDDDDFQFGNDENFHELELELTFDGGNERARLKFDGDERADIRLGQSYDRATLSAHVGVWNAAAQTIGTLEFRFDDVRFDFSEKNLP